MKRIIAISCFMLLAGTALMCVKLDPNFARVKISAPDEEIGFTGFYMSATTDSTTVDAMTSASYQIAVDPESDSVVAGFIKSDSADTQSELRVRLYYMGKTRDEAEITSGRAKVRCDIP
ncbi:hypothetical protein JXM67_01055 [candidate division WOR-3 bacterium]|nr:hypothetical protein [candidate division WOR-3 bacterium]